MTVDIKKRVEQYVALRDKIKAIEADQKEHLKPYKNMLEQLNGTLLQHLNDINTDSASTEAGSVYRTAKKSASLADAQAFMDFVVANQAFDLLDRKANVSAVEDYINDNKVPPPGVNFSTTYIVGVRRK
jgi:hypothetical protein